MALFGQREATRPKSRPVPQKATGAELPDWGFPLFPPKEIELLQAAFDADSYDFSQLERASYLVGFVVKDTVRNPITKDGYIWDVGFVYILPGKRPAEGGEAIVLFPRKDDVGQSSRHCAVYVRKTEKVTDYVGKISQLVHELGLSIKQRPSRR